MFEALDRQLARFSPRLRDDLGLTGLESARTASAVADDLRAPGTLDRLLAEDDEVGFPARYEEIPAFQGFMDATRAIQPRRS